MNNNEMKNRWIALYVENEVGVLAKVSGLFLQNPTIYSLLRLEPQRMRLFPE